MTSCGVKRRVSRGDVGGESGHVTQSVEQRTRVRKTGKERAREGKVRGQERGTVSGQKREEFKREESTLLIVF